MTLSGWRWKSSQWFPGNASILQSSILDPTFFEPFINDFPDVICEIAIFADDTRFYLKFFPFQVVLYLYKSGTPKYYFS